MFLYINTLLSFEQYCVQQIMCVIMRNVALPIRPPPQTSHHSAVVNGAVPIACCTPIYATAAAISLLTLYHKSAVKVTYAIVTRTSDYCCANFMSPLLSLALAVTARQLLQRTSAARSNATPEAAVQR